VTDLVSRAMLGRVSHMRFRFFSFGTKSLHKTISFGRWDEFSPVCGQFLCSTTLPLMGVVY
jgi:hypothetical protein